MLPEQTSPLIRPTFDIGDLEERRETTFQDLAPTDWWGKVLNAYGAAKNQGTLSTALRDLTASRAYGGRPSISRKDANEKYGLSLAGEPTEMLDEEWAKQQSYRRQNQQAFAQLQAGSNTGIATHLLGGFAANASDPAEILLNLGVGAASLGLGNTLMFARAGTMAARLGGALRKGGLAVSVGEDVVAGTVSAGLQYAGAQQADESIRQNYTAKDAVVDVVAGAAVGGAIQGGIHFGKGFWNRRFASRTVDPVLAEAEMAKSITEGRPFNPANTIDVQKVTRQVETAGIEIDRLIREAEEAEAALPRKNVVNVETGEYPTKYVATAMEQETPTPLPTLPDATKPRLPKGALKKRSKIEGGGMFNLPLDSDFVETSQFGRRGSRQHRGIDLAAPTGTPVNSAKSGKVIQVGFQADGAGNFVVVDHGNGYKTKYFHLDKVLVERGAKVTNKTQLGTVGSTGRSTGPHLHYEVWKGGKAVDPKGYMKKGAKEIPPVSSEEVPPMRVPDTPVTNRGAFDEMATKATTVAEAMEMGSQAANDLLDDIGDVTTNTEYTPPTVIRAQYEELADQLEILAGYTNGVVDREAAMQAFARGGQRANDLIEALNNASPPVQRKLVSQILQDARAFTKESIRKGAKAGTEKDLVAQKAHQLRVAEDLPSILVAHRAMQQINPDFVAEELPVRYLLEAAGGEINDFGRLLLRQTDPNNNLPLYRVRQKAVGIFAKEVNDLTQFLGEVKKSQGAPEARTPLTERNADITKQVNLALKEIPEDDFKAVTEKAVGVLDERIDQFIRTGIFEEEKLQRLANFSPEFKAAMERGEFDYFRKGGDIEKGLEKRAAREKAYTEMLKKTEIVDALVVCTSKGLGRG